MPNPRPLWLVLALALAACGGSASTSQGVNHLRGFARGGALSDTVIAVATDAKGGVFVGTDNGLGYHRGRTWLTTWKGWQITAAASGGELGAYVGVVFLKQVVHTKAMMREARVYRVFERNDEIKVVQLGDSMMGDTVDALFLDRKQRLWVGTRDRGVLTLERGADDLKPTLSLSQLDGRPTSFAEAPDGTIYVGSFGGGVIVYKGGQVAQAYTPKNSDLRGNGVVRSVADHPELGLFAATADKLPGAVVGDIEAQSRGTGISQLGPDGKWRSHTGGVSGLPSSDVSRVAVSPDNTVWATMYSGGAALFRGGKWYQAPTAAEKGYAIAFHGRSVWIGTNGGLTHLTGY